MLKDTVLGLSIGTQRMGLALLRGAYLEDWDVKNFDGIWSKVKLKRIISFVEHYLRMHQVDTVIMKIPESCRSSLAVETLTEALLQLYERECIKVRTCTIVDLKLTYGVKRKTELFQIAAQRHSELSDLILNVREIRKRYYTKVFESVLAAGL